MSERGWESSEVIDLIAAAMCERGCSVDGCPAVATRRLGWCDKHYRRWRKYGDPLGSAPARSTAWAEREFRRLAAIETDECVIWPYAKGSQRGYGQVYIAGQKLYAHREALTSRVPQPLDKPYARHGPCNKPACMNYRHLSWGTPTENNLDQRRDGTAMLGERNPMARLTAEDVAVIRRDFANGVSQRQLAKRHGVAVMTIWRAIRGVSWADVA